jgi:hypothetical protein
MKTKIVTITAGSPNAQQRLREAEANSALTDSEGNAVPMSTTSKHVSFKVYV